MIPTGIKKLDEILTGGLKNGIIDIYGAAGVGKTQLVLQIVKNCIRDRKDALFYDTTGKFRPERLAEIINFYNLDENLLQKVKISRITNSLEQINHLDLIDKQSFSIVVVDNVTDLFSFEYAKKDQIIEKSQLLMKYLKNISKKSLDYDIPILITNNVVNVDSIEKESLSNILDFFTHVKIHLSKKRSFYEGEIILPNFYSTFRYKLTKGGLTEE